MLEVVWVSFWLVYTMAIQNLGKSDYQTNAVMNADFLNRTGQQTCQTTIAGINGHLNLFVNSNNCNFTLIKQCYAGGVFYVMAAQCQSY